MRLAILFHRFGPYHHARLHATARLGEVVGIEFSRIDRTYQWAPIHGSEGFRKITLFDDRDVDDVPAVEVAKRLEEALLSVDPSAVVVPGWGSPGALIALRWSVARGKPCITMSESTAEDAARSPVREAAKSRIVRRFAGAIVGGERHRDYVRRLGVPGDRVALGYDCVDNDYFTGASAAASAQGDRVRANLDLPQDYFLASSRFVERKNLDALIRAHARYRETVGKRAWHLVLMGDGPQRPSLEALASHLGSGQAVKFPGFVQYEDLPCYYALAKCFVHASLVEPWGLVVNEAMASGLPVLVSRQSGCALELVQDGRNGFTFDARDEEELARLLARASSGGLDLADLGAESRDIISKWSTGRFASELWKLAIRACGDAPRAPLGLLDRSLFRIAIGK